MSTVVRYDRTQFFASSVYELLFKTKEAEFLDNHGRVDGCNMHIPLVHRHIRSVTTLRSRGLL